MLLWREGEGNRLFSQDVAGGPVLIKGPNRERVLTRKSITTNKVIATVREFTNKTGHPVKALAI